MSVEPVPGEPAAVADLGDERALVLSDYHAGIEVGLRRDGVELRSEERQRRTRVGALLSETGADRVVFLGDLANAIGTPTDAEREELETLLAETTARVPVTVVKGNHDGPVEDLAGPGVTVTGTGGTRLGDVGFVHGHTWPAREVLEADVVCMGHEHPQVRLEDTVGGRRVERAWLRGPLEPGPFESRFDDPPAVEGELVVFPAFNDRCGGTWVNVEGQGFLSPFLPAGLYEAQAYLLDGTRLGPYHRI
ncbi:MAG: metallophosphoesterase [Haloarculaceae archaeon]